MTDPYVWAGTDCLRNKLGIKVTADLALSEARIVAVRDVQLGREPLPGEFNLPHLQRFHSTLFRDVYDWAGKTRTVDISKGGVRFCSWRFVDDEVSAVLGHLAQDRWLIGLRRDSFVDRLAHYYGELNACHPFREGNGRFGRRRQVMRVGFGGWRSWWRSATTWWRRSMASWISAKLV